MLMALSCHALCCSSACMWTIDSCICILLIRGEQLLPVASLTSPFLCTRDLSQTSGMFTSMFAPLCYANRQGCGSSAFMTKNSGHPPFICNRAVFDTPEAQTSVFQSGLCTPSAIVILWRCVQSRSALSFPAKPRSSVVQNYHYNV